MIAGDVGRGYVIVLARRQLVGICLGRLVSIGFIEVTDGQLVEGVVLMFADVLCLDCGNKQQE